MSLLAAVLESVKSIRENHGSALFLAEWFFTILFSVELLLRLISVKRPVRYLLSFYGLVDLLAIRVIRLLRNFRILKLSAYVSEARVITGALRASRKKISVFLAAVLSLVTVIGTVMYVVEGEANGFTDIPTSIYWAIVTLTTVGYGDLSPKTALGKMIASFVMVMGYAIIAVPTGIVTAELTRSGKNYSTHVCPECQMEGHDDDAVHCKYCGAKL